MSPLLPKLHASLREPQPGSTGAPSDREHQRVERPAARPGRIHQLHPAIAPAFHRLQPVPQVQSDPQVTVVLLQLPDHVRIHLLQQPLPAGEYLRPAAQRLQHPGQFGADIPAAEQRHPRRRDG